MNPALPERPQSRTYCSVIGCFNTSVNRPDISFFRHPPDFERRLKWLELIGRQELIDKHGKNYYVCEEHFYVRHMWAGIKRKTLSNNALPALRLPQQQRQSEETDMDRETSVKMKECKDPLSLFDEPLRKSTRKRKFATTPTPGCSSKTELETQNGNLVFLGKDTFQRLCNKFLTKELACIVKAQSTLKKLAKKTCDDRKVFLLRSLNIYHSNPRAYRMLQGALHLPCPSSLYKNAVPITTEINGDFMSLFKSNVDTMTDMDKNCSAVISSISLKPNLFYSIDQDIIVGFQDINGIRLADTAEKAYVMMVRGIYGNWKQPVGYALLSRGENSVEFNEWIDELLEKLFNIGLNVRTFVSDTGNEFINAAKNRCITNEKPYFFINDRKIFYIFDAPHLIKLVRDLFIEHDFLFQGRRAKYEHVRSFYNKDKKKEFKLAPKLSNNHIHPTNFEKKELRYATQLLSNSVATGISTYVDFHVIDESGRDTADFIQLMNNLFDSLNSSDFKDTDEYKSAFRGIKSQIDFFNEMLIFFRDIKLCDIKYDPKFIEGFQITITSILQLFDDIRSEGHTFLQTRQLNLEVIDNFFDEVRTKCGIASEPTSWLFVSTYRKNFLSNVMKPQERKNSAEDLTKWLTQIYTNRVKETIVRKPANEFSDPDDKAESTFKVMSSDYKKREFQKKHRLFEVSHYLLQKCAEKHECKLFRSYIQPFKNNPDFIEESRYRVYRGYSKDQCKSLLVVPCDNFIQFVMTMDAQFVKCLSLSKYMRDIGLLLYNSILQEPYKFPPCGCFPKPYLVKLFVRMKMYNVIKINNKTFGLAPSNAGKIVISRL